jgi:hypothetical protein
MCPGGVHAPTPEANRDRCEPASESGIRAVGRVAATGDIPAADRRPVEPSEAHAECKESATATLDVTDLNTPVDPESEPYEHAPLPHRRAAPGVPSTSSNRTDWSSPMPSSTP